MDWNARYAMRPMPKDLEHLRCDEVDGFLGFRGLGFRILGFRVLDF